MDKKELTLKIYDVTITGDIILDPATRLPKKDADGKIMYTWVRTSKETTDTKANKIPVSRFLQTSMIELNTGTTKMTIGDRTIELGAIVSRGVTVNIFENSRPEVFNMINAALEREISEGKLIILKAAAEGVRPVCKLATFGQPGLQHGYTTAFSFYRHQIDPLDHIEKAITRPTYNRTTGKMEQLKQATSRGQVFLFGNDLDVADSIVADQKKLDKAFAVPEEKHAIAGQNDFQTIESDDVILAKEIAAEAAAKATV